MRKIFSFRLLLAISLILSITFEIQAGNKVSVPLLTLRSSEKQDVHDELDFFSQRNAVKRFAEIELHEQLKEASALLNIDEIELNLFDDVNYRAQISRSDKNVNGSVSLIAILDEVQGYFTMATTGQNTLAGVYLPGLDLYYTITSNPRNHKHYLIEMKASDRDILEGAPSLIPEISEKDILQQEQIKQYLKSGNLGPDDWANIDVMILYTPSAKQWGNSQGGGIENVLALAMANAQLVLDNSEVKMTMTLVHSEEYTFQETGNSGNDLGYFTNSPALQKLRNDHYADLVSIFANVSDVGGIGWLLNSKSGVPDTGVSITRIQQAAQAYTHIHEMGHNMGCHHHKAQNFQPGPTIWHDWPQNDYSAGWRWRGDDDKHYCSVMTYTSGQYFSDGITHTEVPYFSNPQLMYKGASTGSYVDGNNAETLKLIKHVISAYRQSEMASVFTSTITDIELTSAVSGGEITNDGGSFIKQRGIIWHHSPVMSLEDNSGFTIDGEGTGTFTSEMKDLAPTSDYFVSAYGVSDKGVSYGVQRLFTTLEATRAMISTIEAITVTHNSAIAGGNITDEGNSLVTARGVVWSTDPNPNITSNFLGFTTDGEGKGTFESTITDLRPETEYYYRSYATNLFGTVYGRQQSFTTLFARIYPNPFREKILVEFYNESQKEVSIVVQNMQGQIVKRMPIKNQGDIQVLLNVVHLQSGIYMLTIESEFEFPVWQLIKPGN